MEFPRSSFFPQVRIMVAQNSSQFAYEACLIADLSSDAQQQILNIGNYAFHCSIYGRQTYWVLMAMFFFLICIFFKLSIIHENFLRQKFNGTLSK